MLLLVAAGWIIFGFAGNYFLVHGLKSWTLLAVIQTLWKILLAALAGLITYSVIRGQRRPAGYGFSFKTGGVASLAILAVIHAYLVPSGKFVLSVPENFLWSASGAFMEELLFRAIAIDKIIVLMDGIRAKAFWAILASSALWSALHIPSKSPGQLITGIFLGGLLLGYIYYKSRSILLPAWIHVVANTGYLGGILVAALYCVISFADSLFTSQRDHGIDPHRAARRNVGRCHGNQD